MNDLDQIRAGSKCLSREDQPPLALVSHFESMFVVTKIKGNKRFARDVSALIIRRPDDVGDLLHSHPHLQ